MKVLFVYKTMSTICGGSMILERNRKAIETIFGVDNVGYIPVENKPWTVSRIYGRLLYGFVAGTDLVLAKQVFEAASKCDCVWLDGSTLGTLAWYLRKKGYKGKIFTFFHNIETIFQKRTFLKRLLYVFYNRPLGTAERNARLYSDCVFVLTKRDKDFLEKNYRGCPIFILPSTLSDQVENEDVLKRTRQSKKDDSLCLLFVGANFYANVNGIKWFIANVIDNVDVKLVICGSGQDKVDYPNNPKIEVHGFVANLGDYYINADCVISPIFEGSGMKTKTVEALMWGKFIIGTKEAFVGFEVPDTCGVECNDVKTFIRAIEMAKEMNIPKYNEASRNLYLNMYSFESTVNRMKSLLLSK